MLLSAGYPDVVSDFRDRAACRDADLAWAMATGLAEGVWGGQDMGERRDQHLRVRATGARKGARPLHADIAPDPGEL